VQLLRAGTDVFLDIGIVPMDDLANFAEKREMRFVILDRLVMGLETFMTLHDSVMGLHVQLKEAGILPNEKLIKSWSFRRPGRKRKGRHGSSIVRSMERLRFQLVARSRRLCPYRRRLSRLLYSHLLLKLPT